MLGICASLALAPVARVQGQAAEPAAASPRAGETPAPLAEMPASAPGAGKAPNQALEHYQRGREHYLAGRYREALEELKYALALDPDSPNLIYNVARVHEDLGNLDEAITNYQHYLEVIPQATSAEREKIELTIRRLRGAKDELAASRANEAGLKSFEPTPAPRPALGRADWLFWTTAGLGVGLVGGGAVAGVLAVQREKRVRDFVVGEAGTVHRHDVLAAQTKNLALTSDLLFAGGALAITGAALLFFMRHAPAEKAAPPARASVYFDGQRALLDVHGVF